MEYLLPGSELERARTWLSDTGISNSQLHCALLCGVVRQHDWVGRSIAVVFGLWGIFVLYQLVRRVWDEEHAIITAAVIAILPGSIFIQRSFLPDPAMVAFVVTSLWLFALYLQREHLHYLLLASVFAMFGFLTKLTGLIISIPMIFAIFSISGVRKIFRIESSIQVAILPR